MNFRRSQSKVWFGSQQPSVPSVYDNFSSLPTYYHGQKKSLQSISEQHEESLSPRSDNEELKRSILIWGNRKSPSFHSDKSQVRFLFGSEIKIQLESHSALKVETHKQEIVKLLLEISAYISYLHKLNGFP